LTLRVWKSGCVTWKFPTFCREMKLDGTNVRSEVTMTMVQRQGQAHSLDGRSACADIPSVIAGRRCAGAMAHKALLSRKVGTEFDVPTMPINSRNGSYVAPSWSGSRSYGVAGHVCRSAKDARPWN
jgi:hypothetical protein